MPSWDPGLYLKFGEQRSRPALDLALRARSLLGLPTEGAPEGRAGLRVLDLGCGPGNSTAVLAAVLPGARLTGVDSSQAMIEAARASGLEAEWVVADAAAWEPGERFDLVFSNALLQWIPDQGALLDRMRSWLQPGGVLAHQVPGNAESGLHRALRRVAAAGEWRSFFSGLDDAIRYHEPEFYFAALEGFEGLVDVWESTYWHRLEGRSALIDWYSGTGMRPWLEALPGEAERSAFKDAVLDSASPDYPLRADGSVLFPFRRIFFTAAIRA
jgi:trans-aconitate 2-methyltransferase